MRERKKIRTRAAIRQAALELFHTQGYANTTIKQIAERADVAERTFFRYFHAKEALLICDQFGPIVAAFLHAPSELSPAAAYSHAVSAYFADLSTEERNEAIAIQNLLYSVPEARSLLYTAYVDLIDRLSDALEHRLQQPSDPEERRVIASAIVGVLIAASDDAPLPERRLVRSFEILESKMGL